MSSTNISLKAMSGAERAAFIGVAIWLLLQMSRFVALVLIGDIDEGIASEAWRYPAYLDLFAAVLAIPLVLAMWLRRSLLTWTALVVYLAISIVDHIGNFVTTTFVGPPTIAEGMENPYLIPAIQTALDVVFLVALFAPVCRNLFFRLRAD